MKKTSLVFKSILGLVIGLFSSVLVFAAAPSEIAYQGKLTDSSGNPVSNGTYEIWFSLYNGAGDVIKPEVSVTTPVVNGVFSTTIPFDAALFQGATDRYLQVRLDGASSPFTPRQKLVAAPYALAVSAGSVSMTEINSSILNANYGLLQLDEKGMVPDARLNSVVTSKIVDNAVTTDKIMDGAVTKEKLQSGDLGPVYVTGDGTLIKNISYSTSICNVKVIKDGETIKKVEVNYYGCDGICGPTETQSCTGTEVGRLINK